MSRFSHIIIIFNPNSTGNSRIDATKLKKYLVSRMKETQVDLMPTKYAGHAEKLSYDLAMKYKNPLIISSSGDGGYHEVINGAMRAQATGAKPVCAVLPAGNANDHRSDIAESPLGESIIKGDISRIDLLRIEMRDGDNKTVRYGHSYIGLGLTPTVAIELNRHSLSALKEMSIVLNSFFRFRPFKIEVDKKIMKIDSLIISNIGRMAKILSLENSKINDGFFEVTVFTHGSKIALIRKLLRAVTTGLIPDRSTRKYSFTVLKKTPMQIDGEIIAMNKGAVVNVAGDKQKLRTLL